MIKNIDNARKIKMGSSFMNSAIALVISLILGMVIIGISGYSPIESYIAIFGVSLGTLKGFSLSLSQATPLIFTGLAFAFAYKVKMINTGAEGQLYAGAMAAALVGAYITNLPSGVHALLGFAAAFLAGGLAALFVALCKVYLNANEIIVSLMLNEIIIFFTSYLANGPLKPPGSGVGQTKMIEDTAKLTKLIPQTQLTTAIFIAIITACVLAYLLDKTVFGYEIKVTGHNLKASNVAGINVSKISLITFALSGAIAGMGGAAMVLGVNYRFVEGFSSGYGFAGISIAALAAYNPIGVIFSAFLIGILKSGTITLNRTTSIPVELVDIIQVLVLIFVAAPALIKSIMSRAKKVRSKSSREEHMEVKTSDI